MSIKFKRSEATWKWGRGTASFSMVWNLLDRVSNKQILLMDKHRVGQRLIRHYAKTVTGLALAQKLGIHFPGRVRRSRISTLRARGES